MLGLEVRIVIVTRLLSTLLGVGPVYAVLRLAFGQKIREIGIV